MTLLVDTSAFLWWVTGNPRLSAHARDALTDPGNPVFLSAVSAWEIAVKHALGKLPLPDGPETLIPRLRERHRVEELALSEAAALQLPKLPTLHRDPFDRMLVCQAIAHGMTLVTSDPLLRRYPVRTLW
ncbi:MAG TPA: type II toxin-antitoxin system VapC family toxin [Longimicrobiales bacterium]|nr:type II toxin-antitoxin system VapC family toxin [Longimicrobiales bacterium]